MNEPKRLLDGGGSDIERMLVAAGRSARPSATSRWKTGIMVGLAGMGFAPKVAAAMVSRLSATTSFLSNGWVASAGIGLAAVGGVAAYATQSSAPPVSPEAAMVAEAPAAAARHNEATPVAPSAVDNAQPVVAQAPAPVAQPIAIGSLPLQATPSTRAASGSKERTASRAADARRATTRSTAARAASTDDTASAQSAAASTAAVANTAPADAPAAPPAPPAAALSLSDELRELDGARTAIASGDKRGALAKLDHYAATFPNGKLRQEAFVLRIEALHAAGDDVAARALFDRFVATYPDSAHSRRLRSLVQKP